MVSYRRNGIHWRYVIAAVGWLTLTAQHPNLKTKPHQPNPQERSARALENIAARYNEQAKGAERSKYEKPCKESDDQRDSDLCAQWKAADAAADSAWWASIAGWASSLSFIGVLVALGFSFHSNWIARDTARRQLRAYLTVAPMGITQLIQNTDANGQVILRNVGHLPARQVVLHVKMKIAPKTETKFPVGGDEVIERAVQAGGELRHGSKDYIAAQKIATCGEHIFVWGIAYYDDGYGVRRSTRFCHRYDSASRNRGVVWTRKVNKTRLILDPDKARFHTAGNDAT